MSTEHQQYSTQNQADKIHEYANKRGIEIVKTYADEGKSGLSIGGRAALQRLISDVQHTFSLQDHKFEHAKTVIFPCDIYLNRAGFV